MKLCSEFVLMKLVVRTFFDPEIGFYRAFILIDLQ